MQEVKQEEYSEDYFKTINHNWREFSEGKVSPFYLKAIKNSGLKSLKNKRVLDIGFGRGELLVYCAKKGSEAYGIDYSQAGVKLALKFAKKQNVKLRLQKKDVKEMNFKENFFDAVFMLDIVEHLTDKQLEIAFTKIKKFLKKDGTLVIHTMPNKYLAIPFYTMSKLLGSKRGYNEHVHINEQTPFSMKNWLDKKGFNTKIILNHEKTYFKNTSFYARHKTLIKPFVDIFLVHDFSKLPFLNNYLSSEIWAIAKK